ELITVFYQAEDGIRDRSVTGVQTCALPIYARVVPCTVLCSIESDGRTTSKVFSSCLYVISSLKVLVNSPLDPFTVIVLPSIATVTSEGISIIFFPTRLIMWAPPYNFIITRYKLILLHRFHVV